MDKKYVIDNVERKGDFGKMIDFTKYTTNKDELDFLEDLYITFAVSQIPLTLECKGYSFHVDPCCGGAQIWHLGKCIAKYDTIDDLFLNFKIDGKPFIERIADIEYA